MILGGMASETRMSGVGMSHEMGAVGVVVGGGGWGEAGEDDFANDFKNSHDFSNVSSVSDVSMMMVFRVTRDGGKWAAEGIK